MFLIKKKKKKTRVATLSGARCPEHPGAPSEEPVPLASGLCSQAPPGGCRARWSGQRGGRMTWSAQLCPPGSPPPGWWGRLICFLLCPKEALSQGRWGSCSGWGCLTLRGWLTSWSWPSSRASPSNPAFVIFSPAPRIASLSLHFERAKEKEVLFIQSNRC